MVVAVRCPNQKCRKFMLVEDKDQGTVVACLICKQPVKVPKPSAVQPTASVAPPDTSKDLTPIFDDEEPQFKMD